MAEGTRPRVGVLALQGDVREHLATLAAVDAEPVPVQRVQELDEIEGLVLPGGESTTIGRFLAAEGWIEHLRRRAEEGMGLFGTCAGLILLAREIVGSSQPRLGLLDAIVQRNAFGRQRESFEADLDVPLFGPSPLHVAFIRAPVIESVGPGVSVLAAWQGKPVLVRQGRLLGATFHPEVTGETRLHRYFVYEILGA